MRVRLPEMPRRGAAGARGFVQRSAALQSTGGEHVTVDKDPLTGPPPEEVPLRNAPLVRVIGQVRFSPILAVAGAEFIAPFQEAIRSRYPVLRQEHTQGIQFGHEGVGVAPKQIAWRFSDVGETWRLSLAPDFVALETTAYASRNDFVDRMQVLLEAVAEHIGPAVVLRIGLRYIDRITGKDIDDIATFVRPEMLGIANTSLSQHVRHALSETLLDVPDGAAQLLARWGRLPAGAMVDPNAIEPIPEPSWILDIDMFSTQQCPFAADQLVADFGRFAERLYTFFRWTVTDQFLSHYGADS